MSPLRLMPSTLLTCLMHTYTHTHTHDQIEAKARVQRARREAQAAFLYTLPVTPEAGETLELFYNPDLTPLRGRPEIYVRGGFNRCGSTTE